MASRKEYEMLFQLNAQMGGSYNSTFSKAQQQIASMQKEIQSLNSIQSDIAAYQKQQSAVDATRQKLETLQKQYDNIQKEIKETEGFSSSLENKLLAKQQQIDKTTASLERETNRLNEMDVALREAGIDTDHLSNESAKLTAQMDDLKNKQVETAEGAQDFGDKSTAAFGAIQQAIAAAGIAAALKEIYDAYMDCVNLAADFEETMSTVEALSGASKDEMGQLNALAKDLGATTKFTAIEAGDAMTYMGMAGWNASQMMSGMDGVLQLAAASGEDLALVSDIVTDNLTAFGLTAADTARFADILAAAATNSNTSISIMGETFKQSASIAGALGYSVEDVAVAVGLMANSGIKGSLAGTALKNTFNGLLEGVTLTSAAFGEYEYTAINVDGTMKSFSSTIDELRVYFDQMTEAERVNNAMAIAGQRGYNGLLAILNATDKDYASLTESINNCSGAAEKMAAIKLDNLNGQLTLMNSAWDALKTTLGEQFNSELRGLYGIGTSLLGLINSFIKDHPALTKAIIAFVAVIGTAVAALAAYAAITKVVIPLMQLFTASIPGVNIIMGVVAAVAALTAVFVGLTSAADAQVEQRVKLTATYEQQRDEIERLKEEYNELCEAGEETSDAAYYLEYRIESLTESFENNKKTLEEYINECEELNNKWKETLDSNSEASKSIEINEGKTLALVHRLAELSNQTIKTVGTQEEMKAIIEELNEILPDLNLKYEDVANGIGDIGEAIEKRVKAQANQEKADQARKSMMDAYGVQLEAEQQLLDLQKQREAEQKTSNALLTQHAMLSQKYDYAAQHPGSGDFMDLQKSLSEVSSAYYESQEAIKAYDAQISETNDNINQAKAEYDKYLKIILETSGVAVDATDGIDELDGAIASASLSLQALAADYDLAYIAAYASFSGQYGLFDKAKADMESTVSSAQAALESQLNYWQTYAANVETLRSISAEDLGVTQQQYDELMAYVRDGSEEAAGLAQSMVNAAKSGNTESIATLATTLAEVKSAREQAAGEVAAWQVDMDGKMQEIITSMEIAVENMDMSEAAAISGRNTLQGLIDGASSMKPQVAAAYADVAQAAIDAINAKMQIHSPSRVMMEKAEMTWAGYIIQTEAMKPDVIKAMSDVAGGGVNAVSAESAQLAAQANDSIEIVSLLPLMMSYMAASRGYSETQSAEPVSAQNIRSGDTYITISPQFTYEGGSSDGDRDDKLREYAEIVKDMVIDALEDAGVDAKRGVYV